MSLACFALGIPLCLSRKRTLERGVEEPPRSCPLCQSYQAVPIAFPSYVWLGDFPVPCLEHIHLQACASQESHTVTVPASELSHLPGTKSCPWILPSPASLSSHVHRGGGSDFWSAFCRPSLPDMTLLGSHRNS